MDASAELGPVAELGQWLGAVRRSVYDFREESSFASRCLLVLGFAGLTGLSAQVSIQLPFTPVPVTGQVFGVLVASSVLGRWLGPASQLAYVGLGTAGLPWFAPAGAGIFTTGGWAILVGATGGYLIGFVLASAATGWILDRGLRRRSFSANLLVLLLGVGIIYLAGAAQLSLVLGTDLHDTLLYGVVPFLPGDILKAVLASSVLVVALPAGRAGDPENERAGSPAMTGTDLLAVAGVLAVTWSIAIWIVRSGFGSGALAAYYTLAAAICTASVLAAVSLRSRLLRSVAAPAPVAR